MRKALMALLSLGLVALVAMPATAVSAPAGDSQNAAKICKEMRADMGSAVFKQTFGTNKNKSNAFGKCVSRQTKAEQGARSNASKECKTEQAADPDAFKNKYGTNKSKSNALGKCVSAKAKQNSEDQQEATLNAAKQCKTERALDPDAFKNKYGTNKNKSNAFGKCVSQHAKAQ